MISKVRPLWLILLFLVIISACVNNESSSQPINVSHDEVHIVLFSDDNKLERETDYYDALLALQQEHPDKSGNIMIIRASEYDVVSYYNISEFPTLIIMRGNDVEGRLKGEKEKEEISYFLNNYF